MVALPSRERRVFGNAIVTLQDYVNWWAKPLFWDTNVFSMRNLQANDKYGDG
jgi:hypothetical protein